MSDIQIAPASPVHLPGILDQARATFAEHRARNPRAFPESVYNKLEQKHRGTLNGEIDTMRSFSAMEGGTLAGFILLRTAPQLGMVYDIGVFPHARRRGVGRALVAHSVAVGLDQKWEKIFAAVWDGNAPSHRLFQAAGFQPKAPLLGKISRLFPRLRNTSYIYAFKPSDQNKPH